MIFLSCLAGVIRNCRGNCGGAFFTPFLCNQNLLFGCVADEACFNQHCGNRIVPQYSKVGKLDTPVGAARVTDELFLKQCRKECVLGAGRFECKTLNPCRLKIAP